MVFEGIYAVYALLAVVIPFLVEQLKKFSFIPSRFLPFLPSILGFLTVFLTELSTGSAFISAVWAALGIGGLIVGGVSAMGRQVVVKGIKKQN